MSHTKFPFNQIASISGDGTGTVNQNGNYSAAPQLFSVQCPPGVTMFISHVHIVVADNATINMLDWGGIVNGLTNGIKIETRIGGVVRDSLEGFRIKQNVDLLAICETEITSYAGGDQAILGVVFFSDSYNGSLQLDPGDYFGMVINDNLSTLAKQFMAVWGLVSPIPA